MSKKVYTIDDIDIFIMTHNRAQYLSESISSLLNQTVKVKHITVLDNESTDNTKSVIKRFKNKGVDYVYTKGFLGNFYKAREIVSKPFCMLFHDDDILHPEYLELALEILNTEPNISMITTRYREFFNDEVPDFKKCIDRRYVLFSEKEQWAQFMYFCEIIAYAPAIYRTNDFLKNDLEYERFNKFNDWPFMAKMARTGNVALISDPEVFLIRRHKGQDTWSPTNTPSIEQIINWDLFFYQETGACWTKTLLHQVFIKHIQFFLKRKYDSFLSEADRLAYSFSDVFSRLIKIAHKKKLYFDYLVEDCLVNSEIDVKNFDTYITELNSSLVIKNPIECIKRLQICLITYNRSYFLERTLKQIYADNSPIKHFDMLIIDNASTDNTFEIIKKYQKKFPNIKYHKNQINIGGNANICRAFEIGSLCEKDYVWVLCDDDYYDFTNWKDVEKAIEQNVDCVGVARYIMEKDEQLTNPAYQFFQLTFVPAGIYKTANITNSVIINMYDNIYTMFQQSCISANLINNKKKIVFLDKPIVENGFHVKSDKDEPVPDYNYIRGNESTQISERRRDTLWILGFSNIVSLLQNKQLQAECMECSIPYKDIYGSWDNFYHCMVRTYCESGRFHYFLEIYNKLPSIRQRELSVFIRYKAEQILDDEGFYVHKKKNSLYKKIIQHNLKKKQKKREFKFNLSSKRATDLEFLEILYLLKKKVFRAFSLQYYIHMKKRD